MYERSLVRNLARIKESAWVSLLAEFFSAWFGYNLSDCLSLLFRSALLNQKKQQQLRSSSGPLFLSES